MFVRQIPRAWKNAQLIKKYHLEIKCSISSTVGKFYVKHISLYGQSNSRSQNLLTAFPSNGNFSNQIRCHVNDSNRSKNVLFKYKELEENFKWRNDPMVATIDTIEFKTILQKDILNLAALFEKYNYELRIAGGAVRDLLMNVIPADIDFATTATPKQMNEMFAKEKIRVINSVGEKFGTVTPRINGFTFQVTTLRIDVRTDGRHADVEFITDWLLDAHRRDFTVNAMYLGFDGTLYDYFYGYEDLKKRQVIFIGDPNKRIQEDYLRILRYFRFYGRVSDNPNKFDELIIEAIRKNIDGLQSLSGPRIWKELRKILLGNHRFEILTKLIECGASKYIGLPESIDCSDLFHLKQALETTFKSEKTINPMTILSTLLNSKEEATKLHSHLKFTALDRDLLMFLAENKAASRDNNDLFFYQRLCLPQRKISFEMRKEFTLELLKCNDKRHIYDELVKWKLPKCPVSKTVLEEHGYKRLSTEILEKLYIIWADSNFKLSQEELLHQHVPVVAQQIDEDESRRKKIKTTNKITSY